MVKVFFGSREKKDSRLSSVDQFPKNVSVLNKVEVEQV